MVSPRPPPSGGADGDGSVSLGFELDATPATFDADAFTAKLADELGVNAATLSAEVVDIRVVVSGAPAAATDHLAAQNGTELSESLGVPVRGVAVVEAQPPPPPRGADAGALSIVVAWCTARRRRRGVTTATVASPSARETAALHWALTCVTPLSRPA